MSDVSANRDLEMAVEDAHLELRPISNLSRSRMSEVEVEVEEDPYSTDLALYKHMTAASHAMEAVHTSMDELSHSVSRYWEELELHHDIINLVYDDGHDFKWSMKFSFILAIKVLVMLFAGCLVAPREYLCYSGDGSVMPLPLFDDANTIASVFRAVVDYIQDQFYELIVQALV